MTFQIYYKEYAYDLTYFMHHYHGDMNKRTTQSIKLHCATTLQKKKERFYNKFPFGNIS